MNVSRSHDGLFVFYRSEKFVFNKKLEGFEHRVNSIFVNSWKSWRFCIGNSMDLQSGVAFVVVFPLGNTNTQTMPFDMCPKPSNFLLKTNF